MAENGDPADAERAVEVYKIKKLIRAVESLRGNGTSMISLIVPPRGQIAQVKNMLAEEYGTASNIKSRVNRQSVLSAITSTQQRLKLYNRVPDNGLVLYCGAVITPENKDKQVTFSIEPFKPINTSLYRCDNKFHTEALSTLLESDEKFGFIVMDGNGALFATLSGNTRTILHRFTVDLPKKHGRGGQSALRFARLRMEKRRNFLRKVAETAATLFIVDNQRVNVTGLVLAGSADFKTDLSTSEMFDARLRAKIVSIVDVSYGGENGLNQAIDLSAEMLTNVKFVQEKRLIQRFFDEIAKDTSKYCFGIKDTMHALENGAVETLIVWEDLEHERTLMVNPQTGAETIKVLSKTEGEDPSNFKDEEGNELEVKDKEPFVEWLAEHYKNFGTNLEFITDKSQEGSQFVTGIGGIGGLLRYEVNFAAFDGMDEDEEDWDDDDFGL